jgi:redox-sensitive bicupin YhaK (pirin superfamily)
MIDIIKAASRGRTHIDWLDSRHSFSFGEYRDHARMGFRKLRVINDDRVAPGGGFPTHGHRDMEILTYVLDGALEHKDSLGTGSVIRPGDVQIMSAGTGIRHSEFNHSRAEAVRFLQIWMIPAREGLAPRYDQRAFAAAEREGRLRLVGARDGREGAVVIHQDIDLHVADLAPGASVEHALAPGRHAFVQVARGALDLDGHALVEGDGAAISDSRVIRLTSVEQAEVLLFDLA